MKKVIVCIVCSFYLAGCGFGTWDISELYSQRIKGTSQVLYRYDAWGGRDSNINGFVLLDSIVKFDINEIHQNSDDNNLPIYYLDGVPGSQQINGASFSSSEEVNPDEIKKYTPIEINTVKRENLKVNIKNFQYSGFMERNGGLGTYQFESFKETADSLYFYNLDDIQSMEPSHLDILKVRKGNVYIRNAKDGKLVQQIVIEDLHLKSDTSEMISNVRYQLTPKKQMLVSDFSDYGIFKQIIIKKK